MSSGNSQQRAYFQASVCTGADMINDKQLLLNKYISIPRDMNHVNCGAFAAGIIEGILCSAEFVSRMGCDRCQQRFEVQLATQQGSGSMTRTARAGTFRASVAAAEWFRLLLFHI